MMLRGQLFYKTPQINHNREQKAPPFKAGQVLSGAVRSGECRQSFKFILIRYGGNITTLGTDFCMTRSLHNCI